MNSNPERLQYGRRASHAVREADQRAAIHGRIATERSDDDDQTVVDRRQKRLPIRAPVSSPGREATWCQGEAAKGVEAPATDESRFVEPVSGPGLTAARGCTDPRCLYLVHDGRTVKVSPVVEPGWRVIVENCVERTQICVKNTQKVAA